MRAALLLLGMVLVVGCTGAHSITLHVLAEREEPVQLEVTFNGRTIHSGSHERAIVGSEFQVSVPRAWGSSARSSSHPVGRMLRC